MAEFNRFDICEAHAVLEWDYNQGGWLQERPRNQRRMEATSVQLHRMRFRPSMDLSFDSLSENGQSIYLENVLRLKLPISDEMKEQMSEFFVKEFLQEQRPEIFGKCTTILRGHCQSCGRDYTIASVGLQDSIYWGPCPSDDCPSNNNGI